MSAGVRIGCLLAILLTAWGGLCGCGFRLPDETRLSQAIPELNVIGDHRNRFFKLVVQRLESRGITVHAQSTHYDPPQDADRPLPQLMLPSPSVMIPLVSVTSRAGALEYNIFVSTAATLNIPHHRPIPMRNSVTRTILNKAGFSLSTDTERQMVLDETYEELASQLVLRLSYLGRMSDPSAADFSPRELLTAGDDSVPPVPVAGQTRLTLMEALQEQDAQERSEAETRTLTEMSNGQTVLNREYRLPTVKPQRLNAPPASLLEPSP